VPDDVAEAGELDERGGKISGNGRIGVPDDVDEAGELDESGGKRSGNGRIGVPDDVDEAGELDESGGKRSGNDRMGVPDDVDEAGEFDEVGVLGVREGNGSNAGVPGGDVDEMDVWGCEDATELGDPSVDVGGRIHWPRRSRPRGHAALVREEEEEGDEGDWLLVVEGVESEEGGLLVCGGGEEDEPDNAPESTLSTTSRGSDKSGVVVAVGEVVTGEPSGDVLVDAGGDEVPPESGKKMTRGK
jgi:hypothetical protein